jgi:tetratricopeptide (TPR) repeat protein
VQGELGKTLFRLAQITGEIDSELKAIDLHEKAVKLLESLDAGQKTPEIQADLAACYHHLGRLNRLIDQTVKSGDYYQKALKIWDQLFKDHPAEIRYLAGLARSELGLGNHFRHTGKPDLARDYYLKAIQHWRLLPPDPEYQRDLAVATSNLGMVYKGRGKKEESDKALTEAREIQQKLVDSAPNVSQYQNDLARTDYVRGDLKAAAERWQALVNRHPNLTEPYKTLAEANGALALVNLRNGKFQEAQQASSEAVKILRGLVDTHKGISNYEGDLARGLFVLGEAHRATKSYDQAQKAYEEAIAIQTTLMRAHPDVPLYQSALATTQYSLGILHEELALYDQALAAYDQVISLLEPLSKAYPEEEEYQGNLKFVQARKAKLMSK